MFYVTLMNVCVCVFRKLVSGPREKAVTLPAEKEEANTHSGII